MANEPMASMAEREADAQRTNAAAAAKAAPGRPSAGPGSAAKLGLAIGSDRLLVDLSEAGEIVPLPSMILAVPLTRDWLLGVTNLRGSLHTVADLRRFALGQFTDAGKEARVLALAEGLEFNVTLVVSKMLGLRNTASMKPLEGGMPASAGADSLVGCTRPWLGQVHVVAEGHYWRELSLARLAEDHEFLLIGRH
ncbi:MAG: chemotaxis protein CheW [Burkholderiaceae bacterium]